MEQFEDDDTPSDTIVTDEDVVEELLDEEIVGEEDEEEADGEDQVNQPERPTAPPPPPPGLKEISSLASWTVSSSKPGCGVAALRAPTTSQFWQSDGPQPHHLNIHFFKLVSIVGIRVYLDFDLDESYTPTLIKFFAGTGYNDLQEFSIMKFENPRGWMDVDFEGVGEPGGEGDDDADAEDDIMADMQNEDEKENQDKRSDRMPILRAMLVQVRICENHQNGKDTHLRGLQIFAKDATARRVATTTEARAPSVAVRSTEAQIKKKRQDKMWEIPEWAAVDTLR